MCGIVEGWSNSARGLTMFIIRRNLCTITDSVSAADSVHECVSEPHRRRSIPGYLRHSQVRAHGRRPPGHAGLFAGEAEEPASTPVAPHPVGRSRKVCGADR
jgi:hypothetical protein